MKKPRWASAVASLFAVGAGGIFLLWSLVCLLGGLDGRIGEPESFVYAFFFWLVGFMTVAYSWKWFRWSLKGIGSHVENRPGRAFNVKAGAVCGVEFDMVGHIVAHTSVTPVVYDGEKDLEWRRQSSEELVFSKADSRSSPWRFRTKDIT